MPVPLPPPLHLAVASRREEIERVQAALDELLRQLALDDEARHRIDLAVREAMANAIVHGNRERVDKRVRISAEVTDDALLIRIDDEGDGFDFARVEDPRAPDRRLLPHGRGLWLMRSFVDELHVERCPEGGTSVILRARLARPFRPSGTLGNSEAIMKITQRTSGDVTILDVNGKLTIGEGDYLLREAVRSALAEGKRKVLINLAEVTAIDSSGIGELVSSYTTASHQGGKLKLLNPTRKIYDLLVITQLISVFEVFDSENEAVESFA